MPYRDKRRDDKSRRERAVLVRQCKQCMTTFVFSASHPKLYCTFACRMKAKNTRDALNHWRRTIGYKPMIKKCILCCNTFKFESRQKYCSSECFKMMNNIRQRKRWKTKGKELSCVSCKKSFRQSRSGQITCSAICAKQRQLFMMKKQRERLKPEISLWKMGISKKVLSAASWKALVLVRKAQQLIKLFRREKHA